MPTTIQVYFSKIGNNTDISVGHLAINTDAGVHCEWNTKTGLVASIIPQSENKRYTGTGYGAFEPGDYTLNVSFLEEGSYYKITWKDLYL